MGFIRYMLQQVYDWVNTRYLLPARLRRESRTILREERSIREMESTQAYLKETDPRTLSWSDLNRYASLAYWNSQRAYELELAKGRMSQALARLENHLVSARTRYGNTPATEKGEYIAAAEAETKERLHRLREHETARPFSTLQSLWRNERQAAVA